MKKKILSKNNNKKNLGDIENAIKSAQKAINLNSNITQVSQKKIEKCHFSPPIFSFHFFLLSLFYYFKKRLINYLVKSIQQFDKQS